MIFRIGLVCVAFLFGAGVVPEIKPGLLQPGRAGGLAQASPATPRAAMTAMVLKIMGICLRLARVGPEW